MNDDFTPAHDPHEVTVQLDGISGQLDELLVRQAASSRSARSQENSDGPVFVDESGRRSRRFRRIGIAIGLACAVYAVVIVATVLSGNSNAAWLPMPGQDEGKPAGRVDSPVLPTDSASPSGTAAVSPGTTPSAGESATTSPSPGATASDAGASPGEPGTTTDPTPTSTGTAPDLGTKPTAPDPTPTTTAPVDESTAPTPTESEPVDTPAETDGTEDGAATDTVADGPATPAPTATEPGEPRAIEPSPTLSAPPTSPAPPSSPVPIA